MKIEIETDLGVVFRLDGEMVLLPIGENERAEAFAALTHSLSLIAGIMQPFAKEDNEDQCSKANLQSAYPRKSGVVVPLR